MHKTNKQTKKTPTTKQPKQKPNPAKTSPKIRWLMVRTPRRGTPRDAPRQVRAAPSRPEATREQPGPPAGFQGARGGPGLDRGMSVRGTRASLPSLAAFRVMERRSPVVG
ncbi:PREDICTED: putative uncharacterized protein encoded by LINC00472 [Calidris pugnax]|uniref:putative uncharacterized protein encoded by LINC00472 n=1 Tax=Calidris pugnax TaxID=198806 RepID=UPI00071D12C2|nr:PREDICTED: putative uncharacterized protein encoded by LINC00472 [Calidris pugnax]